MGGRAIIFSDAHGEPDVVRRVIEHAAPSPGDRLIFAGDAIDEGRRSVECLELIEASGAECLVGNHEHMLLAGYMYSQLGADDVATVKRVVRRWPLALAVEGVLITHAGVSQDTADRMPSRVRGDAERMAAWFNDQYVSARDRGVTGSAALDLDGPLWYRPRGSEPFHGVKQVSGHTPPAMLFDFRSEEYLSERGFFLVDPNVRGWRGRGFAEPVPCRYAVIEEGRVSVVEC